MRVSQQMMSLFNAAPVPVTTSNARGCVLRRLPRSGTYSTKHALDQLLPGKKCHHMFEAWGNKELPQWAALAKHGWDAERKNILKILSNYQCTIDMPSMLWWKDLKKEFPNAKVLLTVRDSFDAWYSSQLETVYVHWKLNHQLPWWSAPLFPQTIGHMRPMDAFFGPGGLFDGRFEDKEFARKEADRNTGTSTGEKDANRSYKFESVYEDFHEDVKRSVPSDQLLVFNVKQGWAPLCEFLGVLIPDTPFPRVNETENFKAMLENERRIRPRRMNIAKAGAAAVLAGAAATVIAAIRRR